MEKKIKGGKFFSCTVDVMYSSILKADSMQINCTELQRLQDLEA